MTRVRAPILTEFDALVVTIIGVPVLILPPAVKAVILTLAVALVLVHVFATPGWLQRALIDQDNAWRDETPGSS